MSAKVDTLLDKATPCGTFRLRVTVETLSDEGDADRTARALTAVAGILVGAGSAILTGIEQAIAERRAS